MLIVFNYTAPNVKYDAQVKSRVTGIETKFETSTFVEHLNEWFEANEKEVKGIADKAILARKAKEAARKAKEAVRGVEKKKDKDAFVEFSSKLADASSDDREKCEIYIIEGDSAGGNMKTARNKIYQAVLPVRGKILNVEKAPLEKIMKNEEIRAMITAFGLEVDVKKGVLTFSKNGLRYGKIIIMSDADVDGKPRVSADEKLFA